MSDLPPDRRAVNRATGSGGSLTTRAPGSRNPLDCLACGAPFQSRAGLAWHRLNFHLRVSNAIGARQSLATAAQAAVVAAAAAASDAAAANQDETAAAAASCEEPGGAGVPPGPAGAADDGGDGAMDVGAGAAADGAAAPAAAEDVSAAADAALDPTKNVSEAVKMELRALMEVSRQEEEDADEPSGKRRRSNTGEPVPKVYTYSTISTALRAFYEDEGDWERAEPIVERRRGWRTGRFDYFRLRALQRFALKSGGPGLSLQWLEELYDLLDVWDGTKPGMPIDARHNEPIRDAFNTYNAFKDAVRDEVDDAVLGAGWMKVTLVVDGERFVALFRPVLQVILSMLEEGKEVRLWSGEDGPAPPTDARESPLDGDAFRLSEAALMDQKKDPSCFVMGLHV